ncbi:MAG: sigma-70 family RNA polymerase sigma factor [Planctomycetes bacterium]|nr:sigma-70 family RNA polymerase sigma factor [Planctomycetota bacterium]
MDDLVRGLKAGDGRAYERLVREYGDRLFRYVARLAGAAAAEDLTQEVFVRVLRSIGSYGASGSFSAWLFTIANHLCVDHHRKRKTRPEGCGLDESSSAESEGGGIRELEVRDALRHALSKLPEEQKRVFLLREEASLSFKDIARVEGCPLGTALARMHYAVHSLRRSMRAYREL